MLVGPPMGAALPGPKPVYLQGLRSSGTRPRYDTANAEGARMDHPIPIRPADHAVYDPQKMGKATLYQSDRLLVGLNAFEPGQEHKLHAHAGMDKVYQVLAGRGVFLLDGSEEPMEAGMMLIAP